MAEISEYKPNIFKQIVDWVKQIILKLRGTRIRADRLLADELERNIKMLEDYVKQVYNSRDTKKPPKMAVGWSIRQLKEMQTVIRIGILIVKKIFLKILKMLKS